MAAAAAVATLKSDDKKANDGYVCIKGIDKHTLLRALHKAGKPVHPVSYAPYTGTSWVFVYHCAVAIKADLSGDWVNPCGYDRDAGQGMFAKVVASILSDVPITKGKPMGKCVACQYVDADMWTQSGKPICKDCKEMFGQFVP
jgi:hypothetical protein